MARSTSQALRRFWFLVHLWLGVGLCLVLAPICVTGSYEVWQEEIDRAFHPARFAVTAGPELGAAAYAASAQAAFGEKARVSAVRLPAKAGDPALVTGLIGRGGGDGAGPREGRPEGGDRGPGGAPRDGAGRDGGPARAQAGPQRRPTLTAWVDPGTAKVLDVADPSKSFRQTMHRLHGSLLITTPGLGRQIVGWLGWALTVSALTGIWLWWPQATGFAKAFRYRRTGNALLNLHYLTGFWIAIPLAVLAITGALISFPQTTRAWVSAVAPMSPAPQRGGPGGPGGGGAPIRDPALGIDEALRLAQAAAPDAKLIAINLPTRSPDGPVWRAQLSRGEGPPINVTVSDEEGLAKVAPARPVLQGDAIVRWNRRIHDGDDTGLVWKAIITLAGLIPALLAVTGVIVWAMRQARKLRLRRPEPAPEVAPAE